MYSKSKIALLFALLIVSLVACNDDTPVPLNELEEKTKFRDLTYKDVPVVINALTASLGLVNGHDQLSVSNQESDFKVRINWERITEAIDKEGHQNYTFSVDDFDDDPKTFHNLIIGRNGDGSFKRPYLLTYQMSDSFWEKYIETNSMQGFEGKVYKRYFPESSFSTPRGNTSDPNDVDPRSAGDPCDTETNVGSNNGSTPPSSGTDPDPIDFSGGESDCYGEWIDYPSESCGPDCVTAQRSVYVIVCPELLNTSSDSDGCDNDDGEVAVNTPEWDADLILYQDQGELILNLVEYLECLDANSSATITVYIDQPVAGQDDTLTNDGLSVDVGHTFISLTQGSVTRVMGFYPRDGVRPILNPSSAPAMVNDGGHHYDVSISANISSSRMGNVLSAIRSYGDDTYHLSRFNCTDYALKIAEAAGLSLPDTSGSWPGGGGSNPGNLGEDVRGLPNNTNQTTDTTGGNAPVNSGTCG